MASMVTRLPGLVIDRVSFVGAGDDPAARVVMWKAKEGAPPGSTFRRRADAAVAARTKGGDVAMTEKALAALEDLAKQRERAEAATAATRARLAALEKGAGRVSKADDVAGRLRTLVEKNLDRRPDDRRGEPRTVEMALADVAGTREGKRLLAELHAEGRAAANAAIDKALHGGQVEVAKPGPTRGESRLEELAKARAKADGISVEQATAEVLGTDEGRAAYASHRVEVAART